MVSKDFLSFLGPIAFQGICHMEMKKVSSPQLKNDSCNPRRTTRGHTWGILTKYIVFVGFFT
uniref:Uncharacterized protein n=1 Tax=Lepeophtheirus salmonis TaxID=72036 RepID=A0A0K2TH54_LEPSM